MSEYHIDHYRFGTVTISGICYSRDLIILPSHLITGWWRKEGHVLHVEDLAEVLYAQPELLLIGQGAYSRMQVAPQVEQALESAGIRWKAMSTEKACKEFNLTASDRDVAAALHLTC